MSTSELLIDAINRPCEVFHEVIEGLDTAALHHRPGAGANPIAWLAWHTAREQDVQVAALEGRQDLWTRDGWVDRFGLDLPRDSMGYGHDSADVDKVRVADPQLLLDYLDAATEATVAYLRGLDTTTLDEVIDDSWDPPVTRGVRITSIIDDAAQHAGQAAYVRGILPAS